MKHLELQPEFVDTIPSQLEAGVIYISFKYSTAIHKCACGCGSETVTPFNKENGWSLIVDLGQVTLYPSVGNYSFPCKSHYYIRNSKVEWL